MDQTKVATECVERIAKVQAALRLSDKALVGRYKDGKGKLLLGSPKTWRDRLLAGLWDELNLDRWVPRLREVCTILDGGTRVQTFYQIPFVRELDADLARLETAANDRRCLVCLAPTGVGKSTFARWAVDQNRESRTYMKAHPGWRDSFTNICCGMAKYLGEEIPPHMGCTTALDALTNRLKAKPLTVFVDEAHEGGVALMKVLRHLIDETPSRFVYLAYPTEFDKVRCATDGAMTEAHQFLGRCLKPIFGEYREGIAASDVEFFLQQAGLVDEVKTLAQEIAPILRRAYNLRLLDDALAECNAEADQSEQEVNGKMILERLRSLSALPVSKRNGGAK